VGGGLTALWLAFVYLASASFCRASWACAVVFPFVYWAVPAIGALAAWPVARWAGIRPAWLVALLGSAIGLLGMRAGDSFGLRPTLTSPWLVPIVAAAFVVAAWVVIARIPLVWRALLLVIALLPLPIAELTAGARAASAEQDVLAQAGVPLLGPDVPGGYRIRHPGTRGSYERGFYYSLEPAAIGTAPDPATEDKAAIRIDVAPVSPTFAPPNRCTVTGFVGTQDYRPPCPAVGDNLWRWNNGDYVSYFVRRGDVVVVIERTSAQVSEDILCAVARTLAPRDPSYFTQS
jgi:hypothetical protein